MIIVKDNKIIGIEKELLKSLNATLEEVSEIISTLQLQLASLNNTPIKIKQYSLEITELPILSIEEIKIFKTKILPSTQPEEFSLNETIKPLDIEIQPTEESIKIEPQEINLHPTTQKIDIQPINIDLPKPPKEEKIEVVKEEFISISFEDEFSEIEKLLNLPKEEAYKEIEKELNQASKDLDIDLQTLNELKNELFEMFKTEKENFFNAIEKKDYEEIHKIAHKLKGAALNLRLTNIAMILKKIDEISKQKSDIHKIKYLVEKFYEFLKKIDSIKESKKVKIPPEIKALILQTIQNYLNTQNEKQFKKDKKYIEKILNVKIDTIEDLQKIVKETE